MSDLRERIKAIITTPAFLEVHLNKIEAIVREALAQGWDEGHEVGVNELNEYFEDWQQPLILNPYKKATDE